MEKFHLIKPNRFLDLLEKVGLVVGPGLPERGGGGAPILDLTGMLVVTFRS